MEMLKGLSHCFTHTLPSLLNASTPAGRGTPKHWPHVELLRLRQQIWCVPYQREICVPVGVCQTFGACLSDPRPELVVASQPQQLPLQLFLYFPILDLVSLKSWFVQRVPVQSSPLGSVIACSSLFENW